MTSYSILNTPQGDLMLVARSSKIVGLYFVGCDHVPLASRGWALEPAHSLLQEAERQLRAYFAGERTSFTLPIHFAGTDFQERVWRTIAAIPYGQTISYSDLAHQAGAASAVRAAGTNTGRNPLAIFIPCHRVVGKNGGMGGFAGGLDWKRYLLELERGSNPSALQSYESPHLDHSI